MLSMLTSKKSQERELAIRVLKFWGVKNYEDAFAKALETEKSKKLRELLLDSLGMKQETAAEGEGPHTGADLVREILKGGKKRKVAWAYETPFPTVHKKDGSEAEEEYLQAILTAYGNGFLANGWNPGPKPRKNGCSMRLRFMEECRLWTYSAVRFRSGPSMPGGPWLRKR